MPFMEFEHSATNIEVEPNKCTVLKIYKKWAYIVST